MKKYAAIIPLFWLYVMHDTTLFCQFTLGVENISPSLIKTIVSHKKKHVTAGLITNQTGVNQNNIRTLDVLLKNKCCDINYIFVPEHGLTGIVAESDVPDTVDQKSHIPVVSLYGNGTGKMISPEHINNVDMLIFDIQDSGMRHYTYISTLLNTMKIAAEHNTPFVVLDRPNPLGGIVQGPLVESDLISFISIASIPLRHGMTIGELARYFNTHVLEKPSSLHVVTMSDYDRLQGFMGQWHQQLSPNIQSLQSCYGYSFLGLLGEVEPFDVGIGTPLAFRCIMLPESLSIPTLFWKKLKRLLQSYGVKSCMYKHVNPRTKKQTNGLRLEFDDITCLRSFELFIDIMRLCKKASLSFSFSQAFNKAVGSKKVKDVILGTASKEAFFKEIKRDVQTFQQRAKKSLLYKPWPAMQTNSL